MLYNLQCNNNQCKEYRQVKEVSHSIREDHPNCSECNTKLESVFLPNQIGNVQYKGDWYCNNKKY